MTNEEEQPLSGSSARIKKPIAQAGHVTFELHTLGWEAFQNLCNNIVSEVLGQTVTVFSPTNDAGQDGAFQGNWEKKEGEIFTGRFIIQCKFTARRDQHISLSDLEDELLKAERLAKQGFAQTYLLLTNAKLTGEADILIRQAFGKIQGLDHFDIYGLEWITQQILKSKRLRAFVPRIYGLGDLTQILDDRVRIGEGEQRRCFRTGNSARSPNAGASHYASENREASGVRRVHRRFRTHRTLSNNWNFFA